MDPQPPSRSDDDPLTHPPSTTSSFATPAVTGAAIEPSSATPLRRADYSTYDPSATGTAPATTSATSSSTTSNQRRSSRRGSREQQPGSSEHDPLFDGLSSGLFDASAISAADESRRRMLSQQATSSAENSDEDDVIGPVPPSTQTTRRGRIGTDPPAGVGSPGSLASPLMGPSTGGSTTRRHLGEGNVMKRHIKLVDGEFEISKHDRAFILSQRSWLQRTCTQYTVERTDLFPDNYIKSSRYEWYNFFPKNLYEQLSPFSKPANFYFLCIAVLQCIQEISTTQGRPSILVPLVFVLTVTAVKDALEDYARHKQDRVKNLTPYLVYRNKKWIRILSKNLLVGDLIKIKDGQRIPADVVLVSSGISNGSYAFVDTKELDGETNLKPKQVPPSFIHTFKKEWKDPTQIRSIDLKTDLPNQIMNVWNGDLIVDSKRENVNLGNFILTDSVLRNTNWAVGLIVYTGEDTKIRMNMKKQLLDTRQKISSVFKLTKKLFLVMVILQLILCIIAAIDSGVQQHYNLTHDSWYQDPDQPPLFFAFLRLFTWFIIVKDFIPISLYVSLELVQFWQSFFISWDTKMTATIDGHEFAASAQTSKLNEELSQVEYIFSDKTGTLTRNSMVFRKCVIGSEVYGTGTTEAGRLRKARIDALNRRHSHRSEDEESKPDGRVPEDEESDDEEVEAGAQDDPNELRVPHVEFNEVQRVADALDDLPPLSTRLDHLTHPSQAELVQLFLYSLSLNNSVFPKLRRLEEDENGSHEDEEEKSLAHHRTASAIDVTSQEIVEEKKQSHQDQVMTGDEPVTLEASSPDERALVAFAQAMGFELLRRAGGKVELRLQKIHPDDLLATSRKAFASHKRHDSEDDDSWTEIIPPKLRPGTFTIEKFDELCLLDFTSKRKRMTVVLRPYVDGKPANQVLVFMKGADSALKPFLTRTSPEQFNAAFQTLGEFGSESLRTLVLGWSVQTMDWWQQFKAEYDQTHRRLGDSEKGHVEGDCSAACSICRIETKIETAAEFQLLGATAIEDKLQEGVPHTLLSLSQAGIKIWMLTGDNLTTGINIAISCNLLDADMHDSGRLFLFDRELDTPEAIDAQLKSAQKRMKKVIRDYHQLSTSSGRSIPVPTFGLCFHGDVWKVLMDEHQHFEHMRNDNPVLFASTFGPVEPKSILDRFFDVASKCKSVVACRLEPKEKGDIVSLMKKRTKKCCLAIGDGNNDVSMIREADIGVGIRGVEGTSAVGSSDYSIAQFRYLQRLLLVHGRLNYRRISTMINYIFYKSSFLVMTLFLFGTYSQFSGTYMYLDWAVQLHNVAYTALPILVYATFDRDLSMETLDKYPHIYSLTRGPILFNYRIFTQWMICAFAQAALCFFIPFFAFSNISSPAPNGQSFGLWSDGMCVYVCVVLTTNMRLIWEFQSWTVYHHVSLWGSIIIFFTALCMFSSSPKFAIGGGDYFFVFYRLAELARFWLVVVVTVGCCMMIDLAHHHILLTFYDSPLHRLIAAERIGGEKAVAALARKYHRQQLAKEQEELLSTHTDPMQKPSVSSSWDMDQPPTTEAQKNALLNRRGRLAANKDTRSSKPSVDETEDDTHTQSPPVAVHPDAPQYTGFNFGFTPRSTFTAAAAAQSSPESWPVQSASPPLLPQPTVSSAQIPRTQL